MLAQQDPRRAPADIRVAVRAVEPDRPLEVCQGQLDRIGDEVGPAAAEVVEGAERRVLLVGIGAGAVSGPELGAGEADERIE